MGKYNDPLKPTSHVDFANEADPNARFLHCQVEVAVSSDSARPLVNVELQIHETVIREDGWNFRKVKTDFIDNEPANLLLCHFRHRSAYQLSGLSAEGTRNKTEDTITEQKASR